MIKYAKEKGLLTKLHTNATLLTEERAHKILESELNFVSFSLDAYDTKTYAKIRVGADFDETLENIGRSIDRNHSTVLYASEVIEQKIKVDHQVRNQVTFLARKLEGNRRDL